MENDAPTPGQEEGRVSRRGKLMGKLFGRDRKGTNEDGPSDLNDFLRNPADKLAVSHPGPPVLSKLDISSATRYPNALPVMSRSQQSLPLRPHSRSPGRRNRKGLVVRFVDTYPEIIGEGGDEAELPTAEIGKRRKRMIPPELPRPPPPSSTTAWTPPIAAPSQMDDADSFLPTPLRRTQTGYTPVSDTSEPVIPAGDNISAKYLDSPVIPQDEKRKSFIELHQAQQREAEGLAFAKAARSSSSSSHHQWEESKHPPRPPSADSTPASKPPQPSDSPGPRMKASTLEHSPASIHSTASSLNQPSYAFRPSPRVSDRERFSDRENGSPSSPQKASINLQDAVVAAGDDALNMFVVRVRHLFELFRLQSEAVRPLLACTSEDLSRAALWWFLTGRMMLENAIRGRPASPQAQRQTEMAIQQAYADLAKGYWLSEEVLPDILANKASVFDGETGEVRRSLVSSLRKLCVSMKRNGFLPPEEAFLPQSIDKTIWVEYPSMSQDIIMLLWGYWGPALAQADRPASGMSPLDAMPLGDTTSYFSFGRVSADVFLMEQGRESHSFYFPCLLSTVRHQKQPNLEFAIASQNGAVQLRIQGNKNAGATWDCVRWRSDTSTLDVRLPRGFILAIRLTQQDYNLLWNMYDFGAKVHATLFPRADEQVVFRSTLPAFQYFDSDPQSRQFPRESVANCDVALFERILREKAAAGPRSYHMGFRIAVVTGPRTRTLSGINHAYIPQMPVQFGFLRGERDDPALLLKFDNGRSKGSMVLSFNDDKERLRLHNLLIGTELHHDEKIYSEVPLTGFTLSTELDDVDSLKCLKKLPWQRARIINDEHGGDVPSTVLADRLRIVAEFKHGTITDRVNVAPGELKLRPDVKDNSCLMVYRHPQNDLTVAISEAQVPRELPRELAEAIQVLQQSATVRTYRFTSPRELHDFQAALTGFRVLFDGMAAAFAISRRRMVVPIHKKWEAGATRVQVVRHREGVTQLLAFFEDFTHGRAMGFVLKGTDVFESFSRSGKAGVKFDDAKFPLPRMAEEGAPPELDEAFVCLDLPDLPGEHDDISILFESEAERDKLLACLPAPVKGSRLSKIKGLS